MFPESMRVGRRQVAALFIGTAAVIGVWSVVMFTDRLKVGGALLATVLICWLTSEVLRGWQVARTSFELGYRAGYRAAARGRKGAA